MGATTGRFSKLIYKPNVKRRVFLATLLCTVTFFVYVIFLIERGGPAILPVASDTLAVQTFIMSTIHHSESSKTTHESQVDSNQTSTTSTDDHVTHQSHLTRSPPAPSNHSSFAPPWSSDRGGHRGDMTHEDVECRFPEQDPFHPSVLKRFRLPKTLNCTSGLLSLVYRDGNYFKFNSTRAAINDMSVTYCKLFTLQRKTAFLLAKQARVGTFKMFIEIPKDGEHFMTTCFDNNTSLSRGYFSVIREKNDTEERCKTSYNRHLEQYSPKETLSVLFVGVDGISRQSMVRSMNKTKHYVLNNLKAIEFSKFNKVGDNTFPNIVPLLTGLRKDELLDVWKSKRKLDEVDHLFLWTDFQNAGYRTAMLLDRTQITAFHYLKSGWQHPRFDYYNRAMILKTEEDIKSRNYENSCCIGQTPEVSFLLENWLQLASVFNNTKSKPYFGFSFLNRLTHENANQISKADELYLQFFRTLYSRQVLNNTLIIFFSDHGPRFGVARQTFNGILESRTPFLFLAFPAWFEEKYPKVTRALRTNQHRLVTMFDIHETLKDLLKFQGTSKTGSLGSRGISLFHEIPKERTCSHAGVPIEFCMCTNMKNVQHAANLSMELATSMMQYIVKLTETFRDKCRKLNLSSVEAVASIVEAGKKSSVYQVILETSPNKAVYEGVLEYNAVYKKWKVVGLPVRLNLYRGQAECMNSAKLRPFCYCTSSRDDTDIESDNQLF